MSRDSDKARELADEFFDHDASTDYSSWDATAKARSAILAAMRYAYQEAASFAGSRRDDARADVAHETGHIASIISGEIDAYHAMLEFLESRARDLGAE